jgi:hypothetical protein
MTPQPTTQRFETMAEMRKCIDLPRPDQSVYDECISIAGWIYSDTRNSSNCIVRAWLDGIPIGETKVFFPRPDVSDFLSVPRDVSTGFRFLARAGGNDAARDATIQLTASWSGDAAEYQIGKVSVRLVPASLPKRPYGEVLFPEQRTLLHRENIYGSGLPLLEPSIEMLHLLFAYLSPPSSVIDIGCGAASRCWNMSNVRNHS